MALKSFNPYTASRRYLTVLDRSELTKDTPEKSLLEPRKRSGGRNGRGEVSVWHRGGGHKRQYRVIDFKRDKTGIPAKVAAIEYDPNRSARIALLHYADGEKRYILHPVGLEVGATVQTGEGADILPGNAMPIRLIPPGTQAFAFRPFHTPPAWLSMSSRDVTPNGSSKQPGLLTCPLTQYSFGP